MICLDSGSVIKFYIFAFMSRILGVDYGSKKTGLAVTDPLQIIVTPLKTIATVDLLTFIEGYLQEEDVEKIVLGEPFMADGVTPAQHHSKVLDFKRVLEKSFSNIPVVLHDETFSSRRAREIVIKSVASRKRRRDKTLVDKIAATLILQEYLKHI